jgi:hypothetical protein
MSEAGENLIYRDNVRRLSDAMREVRIAKADRNDVVVDLKDADRARLEILAEQLKPVIDDIPAEDDQFDFAISTGLQPRLWVDATSHVTLARDRRTYRFVRDTRHGRIVLSETADIKQVQERVTNYVAERIVERQRMLEGDLEPLRDNVGLERGYPAPQVGAPENSLRPKDEWSELSTGLIWFCAGALTGAALIFLWLWDRIPGIVGGSVWR